MTEQEEDEELLADLHASKKNVISFDASPAYIKGGIMRDYQVSIVSAWMMITVLVHRSGASTG